MSGVFGQRLGRKYSRTGLSVSSVKYWRSSGFVAPREIGVRLVEAELCQPVHDLRSRERFREEDDIRVGATDLADQPLPEGERLGMRIVHPKDAYALVDPELDHSLELLPERPPGLRLEV